MVYKRGRIWWYKFVWNGESIRESTKQTNKRVAEQIEAAHKTSLAKGEVGIRDRVKAPTLAEFSTKDFLPYIERTYREKKPKTADFYTCCTANLNAFPRLAATRLDAIDHDSVQAFIEFRKEHRFEFRTGKGRLERADAKPLAVSTINRDLATLRKMLKLAVEWGKTLGSPKVRLLPGENRRERALSEAEDTAYLNAAIDLGHQRQAAYEAALRGIRSLQRGQQPRKPDAFQLRDVAITMLDSGIRPDECYRLKPENVREGAIWIFEGKTKAARRRIPIMTDRLRGILEMRIAQTAPDGWLFPADTQSGHIDESSLKGQHAKVLAVCAVARFDIYVLRHTCLTRWGEYMAPARLHYYAGHSDFKTTMRYIHPRDESMEEAMERSRAAQEARNAQSGTNLGTVRKLAMKEVRSYRPAKSAQVYLNPEA